MSETLSIVIDNQEYTGWESSSVHRSLDTMCGDFSLSLTNLKDGTADAIKAGAACDIFVDGEQLLAGRIYKRSRSASGGSTSLSVTGRDKTADLVDCSAIHTASSWRNVGLSKIVEDICKPFGIYVDRRVDDGEPFKSFAIQTGETAYEAINRLCRQRSVLPITNRFGDLVLTTIEPQGRVDSAENLIYGVNLLSISEDDDLTERFSKYYVKGQDSGDGVSWTKSMLEKVGTATDKLVTLYRPKIIMSETKATTKSVSKRAAWEAQMRAGRGKAYTVSVQGFFQKIQGSRQDLWLVGDKVNLAHTDWKLLEVKLISEITYDQSSQGSITTMVLRDPKTYAPDPDGVVDF